MRAEIERRFGTRVAEIVDDCTDTDVLPKPPWRARKESYISHIASASPSIVLVSAADKLHNTRSIMRDLRARGDAVWDIFKGGKLGTLWSYRAVVSAYRDAVTIAARRRVGSHGHRARGAGDEGFGTRE